MNILIFVPYHGLLGPQGAMMRMLGFDDVLRDDTFIYLVPEGAPTGALDRVPGRRIRFFRPPGLFGVRVPYLLDLSRAWIESLQSAVADEQIDLVVFNFPWGLSAATPRVAVPTIYFSNGVESDFTDITLRHLRAAIPPLTYLFRQFITLLERRACAAATRVIAMSRKDIDRFCELFGSAPEKYIDFPQPVLLPESAPSRAAARRRLGFGDDERIVLFHGSFAHLPNREAIDAIRNTIAPRIRAKMPSARFIIAGSGAPLFSAEGAEGIGFIENLPELLSACDAAVLPIFSGCGVRMKVFDYFQYGLPCVSTEKGIEGVSVANEVELLICRDDEEAVTNSLFRLLDNPALGVRLAENARSYLRRRHDPESIRRAIRAELQAIVRVDAPSSAS